jgi:hypothetical protein
LSASELVEKLAAIVPPPFANPVIYHGVLAARAAWRREVVPRAPVPRGAKLARPERSRRISERIPWADLLRRVFGVDAWLCPGGRTTRCGAS